MFNEKIINLINQDLDHYIEREISQLANYAKLGNMYIFKTQDEKKFIAGWSESADFDFYEIAQEALDKFDININEFDSDDEELIYEDVEYIVNHIVYELSKVVIEDVLGHTIIGSAYASDDTILTINHSKFTSGDYIAVTRYNDIFYSEDYAEKVFDGTSYNFHHLILDQFWNYEFDNLKEMIDKISESDVDVYTYKGKVWYIVPAARTIYIDTDNDEFVFRVILNDKNTREKIDKIHKLLESTKKDLILRSLRYHVLDYISNYDNKWPDFDFVNIDYEKIYRENEDNLTKYFNDTKLDIEGGIDEIVNIVKSKPGEYISRI